MSMITATESPSSTLSLTDLPVELIRLILDKIYEEPTSLYISTKTISTDLFIEPLHLNHLLRNEALNAIRRSKNNIITLKHYAIPSEALYVLTSSPLTAPFLSSVAVLNIPDFPYDSSTLRLWKETCPKLTNVFVSHAYSPTTNPFVHRSLLTTDFPSLLRGDADQLFAETALKCITNTHHPLFNLQDLKGGVSLTFPNTIDFWSHKWGQDLYHENRVLLLHLTLNPNSSDSGNVPTAKVTNKSFKNRLRNKPYNPKPGQRDLPKFAGVDDQVKYIPEGNVQYLDYDLGLDAFVSPYSGGKGWDGM